uniref:Breast cancer metastasis-suppressor 1 isoform X1 n=1 Tax=Geotrypetes seraphini TaxID=260995 RepID=A0A6P8RXQ8_GEOSA|nr:breast cancer metastasis-suppressor 1 isoform X1 [Geotrypetes seraphini]XP_033810320.1 breast cancer metastasis-suppressor 1 isoform X1 [Geotrypetes seraphini]
MPVRPLSKEAEEMEGEAESGAELNGEGEESEEEQSGSQSETEEESSEMDEQDCEQRRIECLDEMSDLEKQFSELKEKQENTRNTPEKSHRRETDTCSECGKSHTGVKPYCQCHPCACKGNTAVPKKQGWRLFKERLSQVKAKLEEVATGKATEYIDPLAVLQNNMKIRIEVAGIYRGFCMEVIKNRNDCELQGAKQHLESEKLLLFDKMQSELLERIQRLEEDRQSIDISSEWWDDELRSKRNRRKWDPFRPEKKKRAPLVAGPYIVYMLRDLDILEDWTAIKKAKAAVSPQKRKSDVVLKAEKQQYSARCEDGRLYYEGECFWKGQSIVVEIKDEAPCHAVITAISTGEVWLRRDDGSKTKLYVSQLQKGKYAVKSI